MDAIKQFLKHFKVVLIIFLLIVIAYFVVRYNYYHKDTNTYYESPNNERVYPTQRVFDYADQLTDEEEASLEALIREREKLTTSDIVIVTLNEPLEFYEVDYRSRYDIPVTEDKWVMVYADKFWEDNKFGYDQAQILDGTDRTGDGVILVDNMYREGYYNYKYTWMGTTGKIERLYSNRMINDALDVFYDEVDYNYYQACVDFIDKFTKDVTGDACGGVFGSNTDTISPFFLALIVAAIYIPYNITKSTDAVTVTPETYVVNKENEFTECEDRYIRTDVSKVYSPPSSSSGGGGGGGHHTSGGGGSHGGGGHHR